MNRFLSSDKLNPDEQHDARTSSSARLTWTAAATVLVTTLVLRVLWAYSLANGDELFFSNGAGHFDNSQATWAQWYDFMAWLWLEHTGRTADWLSGAIYMWGIGTGKWLTSLLTAGSATLIAVSLTRLHSYAHSAKASAVAIPVSVAVLLFLPAFDTLTAPVNLTMYSAAVCNYLVPSALIIFALTLVIENRSRASHLAASLLAALTATMHEQSALIIIVLVLLYLVATAGQPLGVRILASILPLAGAAEMFLAPGLAHKLNRATVITEDSRSLVSKLASSLLAYSSSYPAVSVLVSLFLVVTIALCTRLALKRAVLASFGAAILIWVLSLGLFVVLKSDLGKGLLVLSTALLLLSWLVVSWLAETSRQRIGFLLLLISATAFGLPAAAGLVQIRVFNFTIIFILSFVAWSVIRLSHCARAHRRHRALAMSSTVLIAITVLAAATGMIKLLVSFSANYEPGIQHLTEQDQACSQELCPAVDPPLPYQRALSGYGDHDYADTHRVLEWIAAE